MWNPSKKGIIIKTANVSLYQGVLIVGVALYIEVFVREVPLFLLRL